MANTQTQSELQELLANSRALRLLIPSYQQGIRDVANQEDPALQRGLIMILRREKGADLQSVYFTEEVLQNFAQKNLGILNNPQILEEYKEKAKQLINSFLFFSAQEKEEILPYIDSLNFEGVKKIIELYKLGHHKQTQYLNTFAQKDPKSGLKFELILSGAHQKMRQQMQSNNNDSNL